MEKGVRTIFYKKYRALPGHSTVRNEKEFSPLHCVGVLVAIYHLLLTCLSYKSVST